MSKLPVPNEGAVPDPEDQAAQLGLGRLKLLVVAATEPAGKSLEECQKVPVILTLDAGKEDAEVRAWQGVTALRRTRILRLCTEAREQGRLLSYEDLAYRLLNCGVRTLVRDVAGLRQEGLVVPTRGRQHDIGPGQTHRVQAVRLFLEGHQPMEIARRLYHALSSIENYLNTFGRVVLLADKSYGDDEIAFILRRSTPLVAAYRQLARQFAEKRTSPHRCHTYDASDRKTFRSALCHLLQTEFPGVFGPAVPQLFAERVEQLFGQFYPHRSRLKIGQVLWAAGRSPAADPPSIRRVFPARMFEGDAAT